MQEITSAANDKFKLWNSLRTSRGIKKEGAFLLSGHKLVSEYLQNEGAEVLAELVPPGQSPRKSLRGAFQLSGDLFREIDELGTQSSILVIPTRPIGTWEEACTKALSEWLLLAPLGDPSNLGAILRSAEAFGLSGAVLLEEAANPFLPKSIKASAGSLLRLPLFRGPRLRDLTEMKDIVALDGQGIPLDKWKPQPSGFFLVGEEGPGLPRPLPPSWSCVSISTEKVESLNATVAASILFYEWQKHKSRVR